MEDEKNVYFDDLRVRLLTEPYAFERLCALLLKSAGYEDVETTKKAGDGGLDGVGFLSLDLIRFKVAFQAKRYANTKINPSCIDALAGSMRGKHAEKALFITTTDFTREAKKKAKNHNITLISGEKLIYLLKKYEIGYPKNFNKKFLENI